MPRFVTAEELRSVISFEHLIEPMADAFRRSSAGDADNGCLTLYPALRPADGDVLVKTATLRGHGSFLVKVAPWFAVNVAEAREQGGFVSLFDAATGECRAILADDHYLSDIRTAAAGALAGRLLAPASATIGAVLGTGVQAYWQALALNHERPLRRLLLWGRDEGRTQALAAKLRQAIPGVQLTLADTAENAVRGADVIITATGSHEPIVFADWLRPGQHITAVGADTPMKVEVDPLAFRRLRVFVDERNAASNVGDLHRAIEAGLYTSQEISGELGDLLAGVVEGRSAPSHITIAKLVGIGAQDIVAAETALKLLDARAEGNHEHLQATRTQYREQGLPGAVRLIRTTT